MIEKIFYDGTNLKEAIEFVGFHPQWFEWFGTWESYEDYVAKEDGIFKIFLSDDIKILVKPNSWIHKDHGVTKNYIWVTE